MKRKSLLLLSALSFLVFSEYGITAQSFANILYNHASNPNQLKMHVKRNIHDIEDAKLQHIFTLFDLYTTKDIESIDEQIVTLKNTAKAELNEKPSWKTTVKKWAPSASSLTLGIFGILGNIAAWYKGYPYTKTVTACAIPSVLGCFTAAWKLRPQSLEKRISSLQSLKDNLELSAKIIQDYKDILKLK